MGMNKRARWWMRTLKSTTLYGRSGRRCVTITTCGHRWRTRSRRQSTSRMSGEYMPKWRQTIIWATSLPCFITWAIITDRLGRILLKCFHWLFMWVGALMTQSSLSFSYFSKLRLTRIRRRLNTLLTVRKTIQLFWSRGKLRSRRLRLNGSNLNKR